MNHVASHRFWARYAALPSAVRALADKNFALLKSAPDHPTLVFKRVGSFWSVRVGLHYRALGRAVDGGVYWVWNGPHAEYDRLAH